MALLLMVWLTTHAQEVAWAMEHSYSANSFTDWAQPIGDKHVVVHSWRNPKIISDAPALVRLPSGRLQCSVQFWSYDDTAQKLCGNDRCIMFASRDDGATWREASRLPFATGKFLMDRGRVHFVGSGVGWKGLWIARSDDEGKTWTAPVQLLDGSVYAASTGWVVADGRLYWAMDDMRGQALQRGVFAVVADLSQDLMDPSAWRKSNVVKHPGIDRNFGRGGHNRGRWLEPNVIRHAGKLRLVVRVRVSQESLDGMVPNVAAICDLDDDGRNLRLKFSHYYPVPGAQNHFHVIFDPATELHWMTCNMVTGAATVRHRGWGKERRFLMLHYSVDGQNWFPAGCIAMWPRTTQAFNYCTPLIDGGDMLIVSRTAEHAKNQHDNDCITFHRVRAFRKTALNLFQSNTDGPRQERSPAGGGSGPPRAKA